MCVGGGGARAAQCARWRAGAQRRRTAPAQADLLADPSDVFTFLHARHIGDFLTMFYTAWAWTAEARRNYALADSVYCKGLRMCARGGAAPEAPLRDTSPRARLGHAAARSLASPSRSGTRPSSDA